MHGALTLTILFRRLFLITLLVVTQGFWLVHGWRVTGQVANSAWKRLGRIATNVAAILVFAVLLDRLYFSFIPPKVSVWIAPIAELWVFASIAAVFCVKAVHAFEWAYGGVARLRNALVGSEPVDTGRRKFFRYSAYLAGSLPFVGALYGFANERRRYRVECVEVPIVNLPPAFDGLRIVQLSDIHIGDFLPPEELRRVVEKINRLQPDLAVITGDLVSSAGDPLAECVQELSRLRAPMGVWGCNGNHEIYAGVEDEAEELFRRHGMRLLRQSSVALEKSGAKLNLIGMDYQRDISPTGKKLSLLDDVEALIRPDMPNILLSHNPNSFYRAASLGIDLTLSGHTHGGQVNFEIVNKHLNPARFMTKFIAGTYRLPIPPSLGTKSTRDSILYVNRGLGTLAIPARLNSEPEITLLTLRTRSLPASS